MLLTLLTIAELVYVVGLATWILFEKRSPVATLAWILSLIALPYVGFVLFFFFGPRRLDRKRLSVRRLRSLRKDPTPLSLTAAPLEDRDPRIVQLVHLGIRTGEPPAAPCERVDVYHDAASTYDAIEEAIANAKHHIHVAYYIFDPRRSGTRIRDALIARAKEGVTVRLLVDGVGSSAIGHAFVEPMREVGIKFARFNVVRFARLRRRVDFRNHRKIVVCDGTVGFTGGINIADEYLEEPDEGTAHGNEESARKKEKRGHLGPWRDTHVRLEGDAVRWLQLAFLDDWYFATGYSGTSAGYFPPPTRQGNHRVQIVTSGPDRDFESIQRLYFAAIAGARTRVFLTTPYFIPDEAVLTAVTTAALRGVDVRVLVPRRSDSLVVTAAARSYYDALIAAGVRVYEYTPTMIHAKTIVVDDFFAAVGTANLDNRSFRLNFEVTAVLFGETHATGLADQFWRDLSQATEIKPDMRANNPLRWRMGEAGARILSPLL